MDKGLQNGMEGGTGPSGDLEGRSGLAWRRIASGEGLTYLPLLPKPPLAESDLVPLRASHC